VTRSPVPASGVFKVLRGEELQADSRPDAATSPGLSAAAIRLSPSGSGRPASPSAGSSETIYGVPVSAVQHCCGRGCKHCKIYWHRMQP